MDISWLKNIIEKVVLIFYKRENSPNIKNVEKHKISNNKNINIQKGGHYFEGENYIILQGELPDEIKNCIKETIKEALKENIEEQQKNQYIEDLKD